MRLSDYSLIPGVVVNDDDPERCGRIQATVLGDLDANSIDPDNLPWIYMFTQFGYQNFSRPKRGQHVWILKNEETDDEYWWLPFPVQNAVQSKYLNDNYDNNPEVLMTRDIGGETMSITSDDKNGMNMKIGDKGLNIDPKGSITLNANESKISLGNKVQISAGNNDEEKAQPVVLGDNLKDMFDQIKEIFGLLSQASGGTQTSIFKPLFRRLETIFKEQTSKNADSIYSKNVSIN